MFFVLLRPIFCEKWKIAPPHSKTAPPQTSEFAKCQSQFWRRPFFFFLEITQLWAEKSFEFLSFPRHFVSSFGQTVGQFESRSFAHFSLFQNSPPPLFQILATRLTVSDLTGPRFELQTHHVYRRTKVPKNTIL